MNKIKKFWQNNSEIKIHCLLLIFFGLLATFLITKFEFVFGSNVDWLKQHIAFPDYFRNLFYQTGDLFPDFATHLGAGQNIFYFAYYGLYSPIIMISYLLPFIPMGVYIMVSSVLLVILSTLLLYYFLKKNKLSNSICFFSSLLLLFSSSYVFHSHRHIMFVNYMPFLILALIGVWRYFEKKKSGLLVISASLMILTSYYYSVGGFLTICLYALYYYLKQQKKNSLKNFFIAMFQFLARILLSILLSAFLLFPVIYVIIHGRSNSTVSFDFSLLKPHISLDYLMYGTYGMGLVAIFWIAIVYHMIFSKKEYKVITILLSILITIPIFNYILNGGLYLNGKVWIPLLPLGIFLIASMIQILPSQKKSWKWFLRLLLGSAFLLIGISKDATYYYFYGELLVTFLLLWIYQKKKRFYILTPILIAAAITFYNNNINDDLVTITEYQKQQSYYQYDVLNYINQDTDTIYRYQDDLSGANGMNFSYGTLDYRTTLYSSTINPNYSQNFYSTFNNNDLYRNHFMLAQTNNLFFQNFMGIRYLLTNQEPPVGYQPIKEYKDGILYENPNVYPIGFSSSHILSSKDYQDLSYIEKLEAYQNNIIVSVDSQNENLEFTHSESTLNTTIESQENISFEKTANGYQIESQKNGKIVLNLEKPISDTSLIIQFKMNYIPSCKEGDTAITINGIMNKLTCRTWKYYNQNETFDYVLSSNHEIGQLVIEFAKGTYDISDIVLYEIPNEFFRQAKEITPIHIDFSKTKGDSLYGNIAVEEDGYFLFTIPYDQGFTLYVDGKETEIECVNDMFIGFPIQTGNHSIHLEFTAPYSTSGIIITTISALGLIGLMIFENKKLKRKK